MPQSTSIETLGSGPIFSPVVPSFSTGPSSFPSYGVPIDASLYQAPEGQLSARLDSSAPYGGAGSSSARTQHQPSVDPTLAAAKAEYGLAVNRSKPTLRQDPEYQAAVMEEKAARAEMSALQQRSDASPEERAAVAARVFDAKIRLARLTRAAGDNDEQVLGARARLEAALSDHRERAAPAAVQGYGR